MKQRMLFLGRWLLLVVLLIWVGREFRHSYEQIDFGVLQKLPLLLLLLFAPLTFVVQAAVTRQIVANCDARLGLVRATMVNLVGALYSLLMPMGAVGYKAWYLKRHLKLPWGEYVSWYALSALASVFAGVLLFIGGALAGGDYRAAIGAGFLLVGMVSVLFGFEVLSAKMPMTNRIVEFLSRFRVRGRFSPFFKLLVLHFVGLFVYMFLYGIAFRSMSVQVTEPGVLAVVVGAQSVLFIVALVPGNLVILEAAVGGLASWQGGEFWQAALAAALLRFASLFCVLLLGGLSSIALKKSPTNPEKEKLSQEMNR